MEEICLFAFKLILNCFYSYGIGSSKKERTIEITKICEDTKYTNASYVVSVPQHLEKFLFEKCGQKLLTKILITIHWLFSLDFSIFADSTFRFQIWFILFST